MTYRLAWTIRKLGRVKGDSLLVDDDGQRFSTKRMRSLVKRTQREAGLEATGNVHILRHTFCTRLAMAGKPPKVIRELAGTGTSRRRCGTCTSSPSQGGGDRGAQPAVADRARAGGRSAGRAGFWRYSGRQSGRKKKPRGHRGVDEREKGFENKRGDRSKRRPLRAFRRNRLCPSGLQLGRSPLESTAVNAHPRWPWPPCATPRGPRVPGPPPPPRDGARGPRPTVRGSCACWRAARSPRSRGGARMEARPSRPVCARPGPEPGRTAQVRCPPRRSDPWNRLRPRAPRRAGGRWQPTCSRPSPSTSVPSSSRGRAPEWIERSARGRSRGRPSADHVPRLSSCTRRQTSSRMERAFDVRPGRRASERRPCGASSGLVLAHRRSTA